MHMRNIGAALAFTLTAVGAQAAQADEWTIDGKHSGAQFSVRHMMVSNVRGDFGGIAGKVDYDGKDLSKAKVEAVIDVATVNTREAGRDEHLRGADFFDVKKYPTMKFVSKKIEAADDGSFKMTGDLTLHGVTKAVTLDVEGLSKPITDTRGLTRMGTSATGKINRKDFGITYNSVLDGGGVAVGDDVRITLDIEMTKPTAVSSTR